MRVAKNWKEFAPTSSSASALQSVRKRSPSLALKLLRPTRSEVREGRL